MYLAIKHPTHMMMGSQQWLLMTMTEIFLKTYVANFLVTSIHYKNQLVLDFILHKVLKMLISNLTP